jgi:hypothetical protein
LTREFRQLLVDITVADVAMCGAVRTTATVVDVIDVESECQARGWQRKSLIANDIGVEQNVENTIYKERRNPQILTNK